MKRAFQSALLLLICVLLLPAGGWAQGRSQGHDKKVSQQERTVRKQDKAKARRTGRERATAVPDRPPQAQRAKARNAKGGRSPDKHASKQKHGHKEKQVVRRTVFERPVLEKQVRPAVRRLVSSRYANQRVAGAALAHAFARGVDDDQFVAVPVNDRIHIRNRTGLVLVVLDNDHARDLGYWRVAPIWDDARADAPAFCRSGAGHPVWGRQWCIDKGFGLGRYHDVRWGRATALGDIVFDRRYDTGRLSSNALLELLGAVVFDRLALHAITLGYAEPLSGVWLGEPGGPRVLQLYAGSEPVAEFVDNDRDYSADVLVVALRPW